LGRVAEDRDALADTVIEVAANAGGDHVGDHGGVERVGAADHRFIK